MFRIIVMGLCVYVILATILLVSAYKQIIIETDFYRPLNGTTLDFYDAIQCIKYTLTMIILFYSENELNDLSITKKYFIDF